MVQLTYYVASWDQGAEATADGPEVTSRDGLRWGYVAGDLDRFTRMAMSRQIGLHTFDPAERYEIAWSAIALELYSATQAPTQGDLVSAGWQAIAQANAEYARHHGRDLIRHKGQDRASFWLYWRDAFPRYTPSPEDRVVERLALEQIWPTLTEGEQEALIAFAVHGNVPAAARALGKTTSAVHVRARAGRMRFKRWWFQGEIPPGPWVRDRRRREPATHCPAGHERTPETSYTKHSMWHGKPKQQIICRICREERRAISNARAGSDGTADVAS